MCRWVDAACVNGSLTRDYLNEFGISSDRITTGFMASESNVAIKAEKLDEHQRQEILQQHGFVGNVFLFVGRLVEPKGVLQMLEAWKEFSANLDNGSVTLALAGEGDQRQAIESICETNNLSNVKVLGAIPYDEIHKIYAVADLLLMPTLEDNWSLVAAEAMSCGLPVINSKYNGCWPELTREGHTGWVFDPLNHGNFLETLNTAYQQRDQFEAMGKKCTEVVSHYTPESAAQAIYQACEIAFKRKQR
jgi:glycosyltransferase involved in cell wall biosynthesis